MHPTGLVFPDKPNEKHLFLATEALRGVGGKYPFLAKLSCLLFLALVAYNVFVSSLGMLLNKDGERFLDGTDKPHHPSPPYMPVTQKEKLHEQACA